MLDAARKHIAHMRIAGVEPDRKIFVKTFEGYSWITYLPEFAYDFRLRIGENELFSDEGKVVICFAILTPTGVDLYSGFLGSNRKRVIKLIEFD